MATVKRHTWDTGEEYDAQLELPVHFVGEDFIGLAKINPLNGKEDKSNGVLRLVHQTACGLVLGSALLRSSDDPVEVSCPECRK